MSIKKKLGLGLASAALGLSLVGGGTFAYFSDTEVTNNTFAAGTLDIAANPTTIIDVENIKPGDWMTRTFKLENKGTLDIKEVLIETNYSVEGAHNNSEDLGEHIRVDFLANIDKTQVVIASKTLAELKAMTPDAVRNQIWLPFIDERGGIKAGNSDNLIVNFTFVDNGKDQNQFQGDKLKLEWKFNATQTRGEAK